MTHQRHATLVRGNQAEPVEKHFLCAIDFQINNFDLNGYHPFKGCYPYGLQTSCKGNLISERLYLIIVYFIRNRHQIPRTLSFPGSGVTAIKLSIVGAGHARDEEAKAKHCSQNIAGMARSYGVIVLNLTAVRVRRHCPELSLVTI